jgi:Zn-dependent protease with chaperone function
VTDRTAARRGRHEPLWDRIERNRVKVALFLVVFIGAAAASAALMVGAGGVFVGLALLRGGETEFFTALPYLTAGALVLGAVLAAVHVVRSLTRPEELLPGRFGAVPVQPGAMPRTESALHDMALAAGLRAAPPLWLIDDCERINAFAVGTDEGRTVVGVTGGFVDRLSPDDQRAVFANLMARVRADDIRWATVLSAVMGPIWQQRARQLGDDKKLHEEPTWDNAMSGGGAGAAAYAYPQGIAGVFVLGFLGVILTEALMAGHERAGLASSEKADAEGMLLLKDPEQMLDALANVLEANNTVPGAMEAYSALFYCWAGFGYAPEEDPEMERIGRLREVLGAAGSGSAGNAAR